MRVSIEGFLLINIMMNALALWLAGRGEWALRPVRLGLAALAGAVFALLSFARRWPDWLAPIAYLAMGLIAFPARGARGYARGMLYALCAMCFMASVIRLTLTRGGATLLSGALGMAAGGFAALIVGYGVRARRSMVNVCLRARIGASVTQFTALVDTGNMLTEPLSGLPVLIADERALGRAFARAARREGVPKREAAYASVNGAGGLTCVMPAMQLYSRGRWVRAPETWLGLYPGKMHSSVHALAPRAFLDFQHTKQ